MRAGLRLRWGGPGSARTDPLDPFVHDFDDTYLELVRLLHEAAQLEHALMVQYLYAGFSLKPAYASLRGQSVDGSGSLLGVAIQEMGHLHQVNTMLVALGAAPSLETAGFPYEPEVYPFPLELEPLSRRSLARYVFAEAPGAAFDSNDPAFDQPFVTEVLTELNVDPSHNHVGSLYGSIICMVELVGRSLPPGIADIGWMVPVLEGIKSSGENEHFRFFKTVFLGTHPGLAGHAGAWQLDPADANYPAMALPRNPSAYRGHAGELPPGTGRDVAWLSNLHYWVVLLLLDLAYRLGDDASLDLSKRHMREALFVLGPLAAANGAGLPFDAFALGSSPGATGSASRRLLDRLLGEARACATKLQSQLPPDFPFGLYDEGVGS